MTRVLVALMVAIILTAAFVACVPPSELGQDDAVVARGRAGPVEFRSVRVLNDLSVGDDLTVTDDVTMDALTVGGDITLENGETIGNATDGVILLTGDAEINGTTPLLTIGDAGEEDTAIVYDGAAQDFYVALDDTADDLLIGLGSAVGTTGIVYLDENQDVGLGGASAGAKLDVTGNVFVDGAADEIQLTVSGFTTNTSSLLVLEQSDGTDVLTVANTGATNIVAGGLTVTAGGADVVAGGLAMAGLLTLDAGTSITVTNGNAFTPTAAFQPITAAGGVTPTITIPAAGKFVCIYNTSAQDVLIQDTGNQVLTADATLNQYDVLCGYSDGTRFIEVSRANN